MKEIVKCKNLSKSFGEKRVLENIELNIQRGKFVFEDMASSRTDGNLSPGLRFPETMYLSSCSTNWR